MNNLGINLKKLRKSKGLNQDELAQILGVGKTTVSNYETGYTTPPSAMLRQLAAFFSVTVDQLLNGPIVTDPIGTSVIIDDPDVKKTTLKEPTATAYGERIIPVYATLLSENNDSALLYQIKLPDSLVGNGDFVGLKVSGDRMDRACLPDGSIAVIRRQSFVDEGDIIAVSVGDNPVFLCRYYRSGSLVILLSESNNPIYRPLIFSSQEQTYKIFGKVIKTIQSTF